MAWETQLPTAGAPISKSAFRIAGAEGRVSIYSAIHPAGPHLLLDLGAVLTGPLGPVAALAFPEPLAAESLEPDPAGAWEPLAELLAESLAPGPGGTWRSTRASPPAARSPVPVAL